MAQYGVSQPQLKREFDQFGKDLFNIDLQIEQIKMATNRVSKSRLGD